MERLKEIDEALIEYMPDEMIIRTSSSDFRRYLEENFYFSEIKVSALEKSGVKTGSPWYDKAKGVFDKASIKKIDLPTDLTAPPGKKLFWGMASRKIDFEIEDDNGSVHCDNNCEIFRLVVIAAESVEDVLFCIGKTSEQQEVFARQEKEARRKRLEDDLRKAVKAAYEDGMTDEEIQELWDSLRVKEVMAA
jgi:hypothetical protein